MTYEVVKALNAAEAARKASYQVGDLVRVTAVSVAANSDGTFTVLPSVEPQNAQNHLPPLR
jgi:hypothetical protein